MNDTYSVLIYDDSLDCHPLTTAGELARWTDYREAATVARGQMHRAGVQFAQTIRTSALAEWLQ